MKQSKIQTPNVLRIKNGKLICADGQKVSKYLSAFAAEAGLTEDSPVNVIERDGLLKERQALINLHKSAYCSFCCRAAAQVNHLIQGKHSFICDDCVDICRELIEEKENCQKSSPLEA